MITETHLKKLINSHFEESSLFLVDIMLKPGNQISIFIDGDTRVTIDDCKHLSRFLEDNLDRETEDFDLTVSSAGADRPLKLPRQYKKNIGNSLEIIPTTGDKLTGMVLNADDIGIEIEQDPIKKSKKVVEKIIISLKYDQIKSAKEVITFKK